MKESISILVTLDIHCYPETEKMLPIWLEETLRILENFKIKATFFFPAVVAEKFSYHIKCIIYESHEIGCHGLTHGPDEHYNLLPFEKQKTLLQEAKQRIEEALSIEVISFRSPIFKINGNTVRALEETGFRIDSSVNPQRLGILSSDIKNIGWLFAPRRPYHPSYKNPFKSNKNGSKIWEIPESAFIFPFMSNTGIVFGERFMRFFYRLLYIESCFKNSTIVYMFHPEDIFPNREKRHYSFKWKHLFPSARTGFEVRKILYHNKDPKKISNQILKLLQLMRETKNVKFRLFTEMLKLLDDRHTLSQ